MIALGLSKSSCKIYCIAWLRGKILVKVNIVSSIFFAELFFLTIPLANWPCWSCLAFFFHFIHESIDLGSNQQTSELIGVRQEYQSFSHHLPFMKMSFKSQ